MDDEQLRYYAVFGNPVLHSRSPQIYNSLFSTDRINALYTRVHASSGEAVCRIIRELGLSGANITTPFKEDVIPFLDSLSHDARVIGAVNTIVNSNGLLKGYNTDASGITGSLLEKGIDPEGSNCLVLGAGGAGKAAATGLINSGANVTIANRSTEKAAGFARLSGCKFSGLDDAVRIINDFDILVLTLPPGVFPFDPGRIKDDMVIVDANYRSPEKTTGPGGRQQIIRGERWLLHQAVGAYMLFTGKVADKAAMEEGLNSDTDPDAMVIKIFKNSGTEVLTGDPADLIVDGSDLDESNIKAIIDEERDKAFGSKR